MERGLPPACLSSRDLSHKQMYQVGFVCGVWGIHGQDSFCHRKEVSWSRHESRVQARLSGACVLFTAAATGRGVMSGDRKAAALAVYRQIAVLFTAAHISLRSSETQLCGSGPCRKSPVWKVTQDCGGPGKEGPALFKVGEPMVRARSQQITPQGVTTFLA